MTDDGLAVAAVAATSAGGPSQSENFANQPAQARANPVKHEHSAESFCMQLQRPNLSDILHLISLLNSDSPARGQACPDSFSWTSGAYAKGPLRGVRKNASLFPACTRVLCRLVLQTFPEADFTAVAIFKNLKTALHIDMNNESDSLNYLIPVTVFQGGEVWQQGPGTAVVQDELGQNLTGHFVPVASGPCTIDPRTTHCTMPWVGDRVLLVAFKPAHACELSTPFRQQLLDLGFPLRAFARQPDLQPLPRALKTASVQVASASVASPEASHSKPGTDGDPRWHDPLVIELFAGGGRVTACLKQLRVSAVGVDADPSSATTACLKADLASAAGRDLCNEWLASPRLAGIFATPPQGLAAPALEFLSGLVPQLVRRGVLCVLCNPRDSLYWQHATWSSIAHHFSFVACQHCAFGGDHSSHTAFAVSSPGFSRLARFCSGPPCKSITEPTQGAYPVRLAMQVACCFAEHFLAQGWVTPPQTFDAFDPRLEVPMSRACPTSC